VTVETIKMCVEEGLYHQALEMTRSTRIPAAKAVALGIIGEKYSLSGVTVDDEARRILLDIIAPLSDGSPGNHKSTRTGDGE
jgi:hypothetical protein